MAEIEKVFSSKQFCDKLIHIATELKTEYVNKFPRNLGYYDSSKEDWSWDCWNLIKSLIWGWEEKRVNKYYCYEPGKYGLGDWAGSTILSKCSNKSSDFNHLEKGEYLLTADGGHAGIYVGEIVYKDKKYNVAECTSAWGGGVKLTYLDSNGIRYRDGSMASKNSAWKYHAYLPWIDYIEDEEEKEEEKRKEMEKELALVKEEHWEKYLIVADEIIDGKWGNNPERKRSLNSCGYDYRLAQDIVNTICKYKK